MLVCGPPNLRLLGAGWLQEEPILANPRRSGLQLRLRSVVYRRCDAVRPERAD